MKFGSKMAIFGMIWGGFEGFGPCLGITQPPTTFGRNLPIKTGFFTPSLIADFHFIIVICSLVVDVPAEVFDQSLPLLVMVFNKSD